MHVAAYPSIFNPNQKLEAREQAGVPQFEPQLKAGGTWDASLNIPENIRDVRTANHTAHEETQSVTWIIDITSQIIFSSSATVHYELLLARDETSLNLGIGRLLGNPQTPAGKVQDHQRGKEHSSGHHVPQANGIFSKAIKLVVDDTASLWNKPAWPSWEDEQLNNEDANLETQVREDITHQSRHTVQHQEQSSQGKDSRQAKKVHLVILTHGLHSNLCADLLYLKESIDTAAKEARKDASKRRAQRRAQQQHQKISGGDLRNPDEDPTPTSSRPGTAEQEPQEEDEEVVVRGFAENVVRTERGIKYLGKRLAKFVLRTTYPHQPFLPMKRPGSGGFSLGLGSDSKDTSLGHSAALPSGAPETAATEKKLPYRITSISFIGHSLGGLVQTYAIAYIQKHSPQFFEIIRPINFIALATPFLGLSSENPLYVKFALDFGLVGRTGQDLGLAWSPPNLARSGWSAIVGLGSGQQKARYKEQDPEAKPLLRILPTGPAHKALRMFRNRTVYANVVNDGIVPLRTSCLLFLDWSSLGRVEKARRETGLVGTMAEWGWAELTGTRLMSHNGRSVMNGTASPIGDSENDRLRVHPGNEDGGLVPQPPATATEADMANVKSTGSDTHQPAEAFLKPERDEDKPRPGSPSAFSSFLTFFSSDTPKSSPRPAKVSKMYQRSQTIHFNQGDVSAIESNNAKQTGQSSGTGPPKASSGYMNGDANGDKSGGVLAPPKTSIFESAGALLNPPMPSTEYLVDPSTRPRTIFHDRVYHATDIPPLPMRRRTRVGRSLSSFSDDMAIASHDHGSSEVRHSEGDSGSMNVEEKIARAYHRDLSWRKVLVRLEPDAHNNIIVRRMFANAYGWPVIKHLVDTHFSNSDVARMPDEQESGKERAKAMDQAVGEDGEEVENAASDGRTNADEAKDLLGGLGRPTSSSSAGQHQSPN